MVLHVMIHCCLSRYYALLGFVCSVIKQTEKAAVIETWGINKDKLSSSPNSASVMRISPPCAYEYSFASWLLKLVACTLHGIIHGKYFNVTEGRTGIMSCFSHLKWLICMVPGTWQLLQVHLVFYSCFSTLAGSNVPWKMQ